MTSPLAARATDRSWLRAAGALFAVGWGANQYSSMLLVYRAQLHVSATTADLLFGVYAVGLIPALLVGGPLSDRYGRRRVVLPVTAVSAVATVLLMLGAAAGLPALYAGRLLAGIVSGLAFAPATAWVKELSSPPWDETAGEQSGARRATIALSAGFGSGPLVAGLLAQWVPSPLVLPYAVHLVVVAIALPRLLRAPETVTGGAGATRRGLLRIPAAAHPRFLGVVAPMAPWVFVAASVSFTVLPTFVASRAAGWEIAFAGVTAGVTLAVGVGVQPLARRYDRVDDVRGALAGLAAVTAGMVVGGIAGRTGLPAVALTASALLGAGYGLCLVSGLLEIQRLARTDDLASLTAVCYALTYVGFAAPIVLTTISRTVSYPTLLFAVAGLGALTLLTLAVQSPRRPSSGTATRR